YRLVITANNGDPSYIEVNKLFLFKSGGSPVATALDVFVSAAFQGDIVLSGAIFTVFLGTATHGPSIYGGDGTDPPGFLYYVLNTPPVPEPFPKTLMSRRIKMEVSTNDPDFGIVYTPGPFDPISIDVSRCIVT